MKINAIATGAFYAVISAVLMGTIGVFSKRLGLPAETITFFRLTLGAFFMLIYLFFIGQTEHILKKPSLPVVINGSLLAGFILFYVQAMNHTTMAVAIMLVYLAPLVSSVFAHLFLNEKLNFLGLLLILLSILGFLMILEFNLNLSGDRTRILGIGFSLLAMLCYSGFILINRVISDHVFKSTFFQLLVGGVVISPFFLFSIPEIDPQQWLLLVAVGFFPGFLAILFAVIALRKLNAATFGTLAYFEPLAVVLFGWALFNESLSILQMFGCLLIFTCGVVKSLTE